MLFCPPCGFKGFQKQSITASCWWTTQNVLISSLLLDSLIFVPLTRVSTLCTYINECVSSYFWLCWAVESGCFSWKWTRWEHRAACGILPKHVVLQLVETQALSRKNTTSSGDRVTVMMWLRLTCWLSCMRGDDQLSRTRGNSEMLCLMFKVE